jgi:small-conductance mechanosensitive channel
LAVSNLAASVSWIPGLPNVDLIGIIAIVGGIGTLFLILGTVIGRFTRLGEAHPETLRSIREWLLILWIGFSAYGITALTGLTSLLSLLTLSGLVGLVVSLALQNTLGNLISGVFLLRDRSIRKGDIIEYGGVKGKVVRIALRNTWIVNDQGYIAVIGNTSLSGGPLVNHTASSRFPELSRQRPTLAKNEVSTVKHDPSQPPPSQEQTK